MTDEKNNKKKNKEGKPHLWIPDTEVDYIDYEPTARPTPLDINHVEHGRMLSKGISEIKSNHKKNKTPISDELVIFKMELREGEKIDARGGYQKIFLDNKLKVNAIKKSNIAIVSTEPENLDKIDSKLGNYIKKSGKSSDFFQHINSITTVDDFEKETKEFSTLKEQLLNEKQDIQITLVPNLSLEIYEKMFKYLHSKIMQVDGEIIGEPFMLSNNTPVIRVMMPSSGINQLTDQEIIYQVGLTPFFGTNNRGGVRNEIDISDCTLNFVDDPREYPIICILDDGVKFPKEFSDCIAGQWVPQDISLPTTCEHGTRVASCAIFGENIHEQVKSKIFTPRARVIDAIISDGKSPIADTVLLKRIKQAVMDIKDKTRIFCLSFNQLRAMTEDSVTNFSFELDCLMREHGVQFVVPTGNHNLWQYYSNYDEIIDDDSGLIAAPGETFFGLTVGAITTDDHKLSISGQGELSPFSRFGLGFAGSQKPDLVYPGGNVFVKSEKKYISSGSIHVISSGGKVALDFGTSYSAPLAALDLALLTQKLSSKDPFISKALLIHHAEHIDELYDTRSYEERELLNRMYGKGKGSYFNAVESNQSRATFIRRGTLSRLKKQRVKFYMPTTMADHSKPKYPVCKVTVTCISMPPVDNSKGYEYLRGFVSTSLKCINSNDKQVTRNPGSNEGRKKWQHIHHFSQLLTTFNPGDYQIWLQLYTKPELLDSDEVEFVTIVTIEDLTGNDVDVYNGIQNEAGARFHVLNEVEVTIEEDTE